MNIPRAAGRRRIRGLGLENKRCKLCARQCRETNPCPTLRLQITGRPRRASQGRERADKTSIHHTRMDTACYCLFETPLGTCGIAWRERADSASRPVVTAVQLPEATPGATESRIARKSRTNRPGLPPPEIVAVIERIRRHLGGEVQDFRSVAVDLSEVTPFFRQVYEAAREIPPGQTRTYGEIAKAVGQPNAAEEVGQAMARNPAPILIPCHRVAAAGGKPGGFSAYGGRSTKSKLLALEGAPVNLHLFS